MEPPQARLVKLSGWFLYSCRINFFGYFDPGGPTPRPAQLRRWPCTLTFVAQDLAQLGAVKDTHDVFEMPGVSW